jgi:hypothetical protein
MPDVVDLAEALIYGDYGAQRRSQRRSEQRRSKRSGHRVESGAEKSAVAVGVGLPGLWPKPRHSGARIERAVPHAAPSDARSCVPWSSAASCASPQAPRRVSFFAKGRAGFCRAAITAPFPRLEK